MCMKVDEHLELILAVGLGLDLNKYFVVEAWHKDFGHILETGKWSMKVRYTGLGVLQTEAVVVVRMGQCIVLAPQKRLVVMDRSVNGARGLATHSSLKAR